MLNSILFYVLVIISFLIMVVGCVGELSEGKLIPGNNIYSYKDEVNNVMCYYQRADNISCVKLGECK